MTSILADRQYTLDFCKELEEHGMINELGDNIIAKINKIAGRVGAPSYQKTPIFKRHHVYKKYKKDDKEWEKLRNFKTTNLEKNVDGIEAKIDDIRSNLNKLTDKTYNDIFDNIVYIINEIMSETPGEHLEKIGKSIFDIGCLNKFWSQLYVKIYKALIEKFPVMEDICLNNFDNFSTVFDNIEFVDPNVDYIKFCDCNKINEKRRALSSFFIYCVEFEIIAKEKMEVIILNLFKKIEDNITDEDKKKEIEEVVENISIMLTKGKKSVQSMASYDTILNKITEISESDVKVKKGLTKKVLFKCLDITDELDD